jgi:hypothetical protein
MATNAVDHIILDFCDGHREIFIDDDPIQQSQLANEMALRMKKQLKTDFGVSRATLLHCQGPAGS